MGSSQGVIGTKTRSKNDGRNRVGRRKSPAACQDGGAMVVARRESWIGVCGLQGSRGGKSGGWGNTCGRSCAAGPGAGKTGENQAPPGRRPGGMESGAQKIAGNPGAVLAHGECPQHLDVTQTHRRGVGHRSFDGTSRSTVRRRIIELPGVRFGITGETVEHAIIGLMIRQRDEIHHATTCRNRQFAGISTHEIEAADARRSARHFR